MYLGGSEPAHSSRSVGRDRGGRNHHRSHHGRWDENMTPLWLVGEHHGRKIAHKVASATCKVGRDPTSDLLLPSQTVSRNHAILEVEENGVRVSDLGSRNGTRVNGRPVTGTAPVRAG